MAVGLRIPKMPLPKDKPAVTIPEPAKKGPTMIRKFKPKMRTDVTAPARMS